MNTLVDALKRAVRAEIAAASGPTGLISESRRLTSLAERMEVERSWAYVANVAAQLNQERHEAFQKHVVEGLRHLLDGMSQPRVPRNGSGS